MSADDATTAEEARKRREARTAEFLRDQRLEPIHAHVKRVVRVLTTPPEFRIETTGLDVMLTPRELYTQAVARPALIGAIGRPVLSRMKSDEWEEIAAGLVDQAEDEEAGPEDSPAGRCAVWIEEYVRSRGIEEESNPEDVWAYNTKRPFCLGDDAFLFGVDLKLWLWISRSERVSPREVSTVLRAGGCRQARPEVTIDGKREHRQVWRIHPHLLAHTEHA